MLSAIENLLILQDRDRKILRLKGEIGKIEPERKMLAQKSSAAQAALDQAKARAMQIESERKRLELEAEAKKQQMGKYSTQQLQTKKNEEYRALANEILNCKKAISDLEDLQLNLMEQADAAHQLVVEATKAAAAAKQEMSRLLGELAAREQVLTKELADLEINRGQLTSAVEESALSRYERLLKQKGENAVMGVEHCVCGGCHMKLPTQVVVTAKAQQELVACPNCGRLLYFHRAMDMTVVD